MLTAAAAVGLDISSRVAVYDTVVMRTVRQFAPHAGSFPISLAAVDENVTLALSRSNSEFALSSFDLRTNFVSNICSWIAEVRCSHLFVRFCVR